MWVACFPCSGGLWPPPAFFVASRSAAVRGRTGRSTVPNTVVKGPCSSVSLVFMTRSTSPLNSARARAQLDAPVRVWIAVAGAAEHEHGLDARVRFSRLACAKPA